MSAFGISAFLAPSRPRFLNVPPHQHAERRLQDAPVVSQARVLLERHGSRAPTDPRFQLVRNLSPSPVSASTELARADHLLPPWHDARYIPTPPKRLVARFFSPSNQLFPPSSRTLRITGFASAPPPLLEGVVTHGGWQSRVYCGAQKARQASEAKPGTGAHNSCAETGLSVLEFRGGYAAESRKNDVIS